MSSRNLRRSNSFRQLGRGLESLEKREVMAADGVAAGNVPEIWWNGPNGTGDYTVQGTAGADSISISRSGGQIRFTGNNLSFGVAESLIRSITINGYTGNDTLTNNLLPAAGFNPPPVTIRGGAGDDNLTTFSSRDTLEGGADNDILNGSRQLDRLAWNNTTLTLDGTANGDQIKLAGSNGKLYWVSGPAGSTTLTPILAAGYWTPTRVVVNGLGGSDSVESNTYLFSVELSGGDGDDTLWGGPCNDALQGGAGNDTLFGGLGDDRIDGGLGNDSLIGGDGNDRYAFSPVGLMSEVDSITELGGSDATGVDALDFSAIQTNLLVDLEQSTQVASHAGRTVNWTARGGIEDVIGGGGNDFIWGSNNGSERLYGGGGNDQLSGRGLNDKLFGGIGSDNLYGGSGIDVLNGEAGNDTLYGGDDYDQLFGGADLDALFGEGGNDWLEPGSLGEFADGGEGQDWNALEWVKNGATGDDIHQRGSGTCWFLSALSSVARGAFGIGGYATPIQYLGNFRYQVDLFSAQTGARASYIVFFDGNTYSSDTAPAVEGESWVLLMNRAALRSKGILPENTLAAAWAKDTIENGLRMVTGRAAATTTIDSSNGISSGGSLSLPQAWSQQSAALRNAVRSGKYVTAATPSSATGLVAGMVASHAYTVMAVDDAGNVTLRNPWGFDGNSPVSDSNPSDGYIRLTWGQFRAAFSRYAVVARLQGYTV